MRHDDARRVPVGPGVFPSRETVADVPVVEQFVRQGDGWIFRAAEGLEAILPLPSIHVELALAEVYHKVSFG